MAISLGSALSLRFPRFIGYPSLVALGAILALSSYFFFSLPSVKEEGDILASLRSERSGNYWLRFDAGRPGKIRQFRPLEGRGVLSVEVIRIDFDQRYPLIGGTKRIALAACSFMGFPALQSDWGLPSASLRSWISVSQDLVHVLPGVLITGIYAELDTKAFVNGERLLLIHKDARLFMGPLSETHFF